MALFSPDIPEEKMSADLIDIAKKYKHIHTRKELEQELSKVNMEDQTTATYIRSKAFDIYSNSLIELNKWYASTGQVLANMEGDIEDITVLLQRNLTMLSKDTILEGKEEKDQNNNNQSNNNTNKNKNSQNPKKENIDSGQNSTRKSTNKSNSNNSNSKSNSNLENSQETENQ